MNQDNTTVKDLNGGFFTQENITKAENDRPQFPLEVFPSHIQDYIYQGEELMGFPKSFSGLATLGAISTATGGNIRMNYKRNFKPSANIWGNSIGRPSATKSASLDYPFKKLRSIQKGFNKDYKDAFKEFRANVKEEKGLPPTPNKLIISDVTYEKLIEILDNNPHGVVSFQDEMSSFLDSLTRYSGSYKGEYLKSWQRKPISYDRKVGGTITVDDPYIVIMGNNTTDTWINYLKKNDTNDGFRERFLYAIEETDAFLPQSEKDVDLNVWEALQNSIYNVYKNRPIQMKTIEIHPEFRREHIKWSNQVKRESIDLNNAHKESIVTKLTEYVLRFSLIFNRFENGRIVTMENLDKALTLYDYFRDSAFYLEDQVKGVNPLKQIKSQKVVSALSSLPQSFTSKQMREAFIKNEMSGPSMYTYINNEDLFIKLKEGFYERKY